MSAYNSLHSPSKLFSYIDIPPTTIPKRTNERQFSFRSPERLRLDFDDRNNKSIDVFQSKFVDKERKVEDLQVKVELILQNNKQLIQQNQQMKALLLMQKNEIYSLRMKESRALDSMLTRQLQEKNFQHRIEVQKLLSQITRLQDQFISLQNSKNYEINTMNAELQKLHFVNLKNARHSKQEVLDGYQLQLRKLTDIIHLKQEQRERENLANQRQKQILLEQLSALKSEFKHIVNLKTNQIDQIKLGYESQLCRLQRQYRQNEQTQAVAHENVLARMGRQLNERLRDISKLGQQIKNSNFEYAEIQRELEFQKKKFQNQLGAQIDAAKDSMKSQKQKMDDMIKRTVENLKNQNLNKQKVMENQIKLLKQLLNDKRSDLQCQKQTIISQRDTYKNQIDDLEKLNKHLRGRLEQITKDNLSSLESLKIKMAELHEIDITSLAKLHETRINSLSEELSEKNTQLQQIRKRVHNEMQGKLHLRKQYQLEIAQLKSKIMDLRIQINAVQIQMKDNITSMRSQLDVTSQGLIRDRETKANTIKTYEDQMRKLRQTIESKDEELKLVGQNSQKKQCYYKNQTESQIEKVNNLKNQLQKKQKINTKQLQRKQEEIERFKKQIQQLKIQIAEEQGFRKNKVQELNAVNQIVENKLKQSLKEIESLKSRINSLEKDVNLARGDIETVIFEQQAAANQQRGKLKESIGKTHEGFKEYYQKRIKDLQNDKSELQTINSTQSQQINSLVIKYKQLQNALQSMLDSQKKLSDLENKIIHLGIDNNLVKNLAEIIKKPFHQNIL